MRARSWSQLLVKDRRKKRFHVGSYTFDHAARTDVTVKWEGDTDVVHGIEPFAHVSPVLEKWGYDARFVDPMKRHGRRFHARALHREAEPEAPLPRRREPAPPGLPVLGGRLEGRDAHRDGDALPRRRRPRERLHGGAARQPPARQVADPHRHATSSARTRWTRRPARGWSSCRSRCRPGRSSTSARSSSTGPSPNRSARERRALLYSYQPAGWPTSVELTRKVFGEKTQ